jgi:hypothetical protein
VSGDSTVTAASGGAGGTSAAGGASNGAVGVSAPIYP